MIRTDQMAKSIEPRILPCGDCAVILEMGDAIDAALNAKVIATSSCVAGLGHPGILDVVPTYRSVLVQYDPICMTYDEICQILRAAFQKSSIETHTHRRWSIPVVYGMDVGCDLDDLAEMKSLSPEEVITLHSGVDYRVYMIGFAPGFAYLGGLPEILHTPRLPKPRQNIPAGAIGIGGQQANINSVNGPSGWRFVGWTPVKIFDPSQEEPFLLRAGDHVSFRPITMDEADTARAELSLS